jgi:HD-like signal output (HDOD) protein
VSELKQQPIHAGTLKRLLGDRSYFRDADAQQLLALEKVAHLVDVPENAVLLNEGEASPFSWFLIDGEVALHNASQPPRAVKSDDPDASFPLANLRPSRYSVVVAAPAKLVRIEQAALKSLQSDPKPARFIGGGERGGGTWQNHRFAVEVMRQQEMGVLNIPAMPGISARVSEAMQDPEFAIADLSKLISVDPAIAGGLLKVANSAIFRGVAAVDSLDAAIVRLGVEQTRTLVMSLAAKALFTARRQWVKKRLQAMWRHAVEMGAYCSVLAGKTPGLDNARGLLLGLLHEIGAVAILELADQYPELEEAPGVLDAVLANLVPSTSVMTLRQWSLPAEFVDALMHQENWYYEHPGTADFADLLIVAHLHGLIKDRRFKELPRIDETSAFARLGFDGLTAKASLSVLEEAQQELAELKSLLH